MLTIFSTPKPFKGQANIAQRNAIRSWTLLHPDVEVILIGDDEGAAEVAREFHIRHEPQVRRAELGPKYLDFIFNRAQEIARHEVLCYANCDIMLMSDFRRAVERVAAGQKPFLMVGRRWDTDVTELWDFGLPDWEERLRRRALRQGLQRHPTWIDYFVFSRGLYYQKMPPFVIGRPSWDPWIIWYARASQARVIDASLAVVAVHQNHDYSYHPQGARGVSQDELARKNRQLAGGWTHWHTTDSASHVLTPHGVRRRYGAWLVPVDQNLRQLATRVWWSILDLTRPIRHRLGIRRMALGGPK
jgi:hypothetical protein